MALYTYGGATKRKPDAVYPILNQIRFGLPQNVMVVSGDADHGFVSIMMATKDIAAGEEIVMDYYCDWETKGSLSLLLMIRLGFSIQLKGGNWPQTHTRKLTRNGKRKIFMGMYSNGLAGRESGELINSLSGCRGLTDANCQRKHDVENFVDSGDIWKMVSGEMDPPSWAGEIKDPRVSRLTASETPLHLRTTYDLVKAAMRLWSLWLLCILAIVLRDRMLPFPF